MTLENHYTLSIIKPDAVERNLIGKIINMFEESGLKISAIQKMQLSREKAESLYEMHRYKVFFHELIEATTEGEVVAMILSGEDAIKKGRETIGAVSQEDTQPKTSIRSLYALNILKDSVHGSDSVENAIREIELLFPGFIKDYHTDL